MRQSTDMWQQPVSGRNLEGRTLGEVVGDGPVLLVFLRHLGWIFCRETVKDLRRLSVREPDFPRVVLVHMGSEAEGDAFFADRWSEVVAIADPGLALYSAFGLGRASVGEVLGPRAVLAAGRALLRGNFVGRPVGDVKVMPGAFLLAGRDVVWSHDYRHSGERPDWRGAARSAAGA